MLRHRMFTSCSIALTVALLASSAFAAKAAVTTAQQTALVSTHSKIKAREFNKNDKYRIMLILNGRYGKITEVAGKYYLSLSHLQPFTELYMVHPTASLAMLPTNFLFSKVWNDSKNWKTGHNKSYIHLKKQDKNTSGDTVQEVTLRHPKQLGPHDWQFQLTDYSAKTPPVVGKYELAHVFVSWCLMVKVAGKVQLHC